MSAIPKIYISIPKRLTEAGRRPFLQRARSAGANISFIKKRDWFLKHLPHHLFTQRAFAIIDANGIGMEEFSMLAEAEASFKRCVDSDYKAEVISSPYTPRIILFRNFVKEDPDILNRLRRVKPEDLRELNLEGLPRQSMTFEEAFFDPNNSSLRNLFDLGIVEGTYSINAAVNIVVAKIISASESKAPAKKAPIEEELPVGLVANQV